MTVTDTGSVFDPLADIAMLLEAVNKIPLEGEFVVTKRVCDVSLRRLVTVTVDELVHVDVAGLSLPKSMEMGDTDMVGATVKNTGMNPSLMPPELNTMSPL